MTNEVTNIQKLLEPDALAVAIANKASQWKKARYTKEEQWKEVRNYVFATDTRTTTNAKLPWRNSTTRPKLCQIRDNLHANYMAALFPTEKWFKWQAGNAESATQKKAVAIEAYMRTKLRDMQFEDFISQALLDYIDYGNCFATVEYVTEKTVLDAGEENVVYIGPRPQRISPVDIVFDITASTFQRAPKILRVLLSFGDVKKYINTMPFAEQELYMKVLEKAKKNRENAQMLEKSDLDKGDGFAADGFGTLSSYYDSDMVELLFFEGDIYDKDSDTLYENYRIVVMDRAYVVEKKPVASWFGRSSIVHSGWRKRPDNLMAMGPLDNLVGMQYRIDHLENLKADVFDLIAFPPTKQKGYVEDWNWGPGEKILMAEDADVESLAPPPTVLAADQQIHELEMQMEEMAGAPKEAMGIRSPGEKTAFEVDKLTTAASRMFEAKIAQFERTFLEPLLNALLEVARRNLDASDVARTVDDDYGVIEFMTITKEDLTAKGKLVPMGARHFATKNKLVQNLTMFSQMPLYQDPAVSVHFSGWQMARVLEDAMDLSEYKIVQKDIRIAEQLETQQLAATAQEQLLSSSMVPTEAPDNADLMNEIPQTGTAPA
jgi:hypothetical protein